MRATYERRAWAGGVAVEHRPATVDDVYRIACSPNARDNGRTYRGDGVTLCVERYITHPDNSIEMVTFLPQEAQPAGAGQHG